MKQTLYFLMICLHFTSYYGLKVFDRSFRTISIARAPRELLGKTYSSRLYSTLGQESISNPLKVMIFIDGTWLHYSLVEGRNDERNPVRDALGYNWERKYSVTWSKLPLIIATCLSEQLKKQHSLRKHVDVLRTFVFTSYRTDGTEKKRMMIDGVYAANFDVRAFEANPRAEQEKCVDISLAAEMIYQSCMNNLDIAVIVTGDKDFVPALEKVRLLSKKVCICSMRAACSAGLFKTDGRTSLRDFDMIWLEDYISELYERYIPAEREVLKIILSMFSPKVSEVSSREIGRELKKGLDIGTLQVFKQNYPYLGTFLQSYPEIFRTQGAEATSQKEYFISLHHPPDVALAMFDRGEIREKSGGKGVVDGEQSNLHKANRAKLDVLEHEELPQSGLQLEPELEPDHGLPELLYKGGTGEGVQERKNYNSQATKSLGYDTVFQQLSQLTKAELQQKLKSRGLPSSGTKDALIVRILYHRLYE